MNQVDQQCTRLNDQCTYIVVQKFGPSRCVEVRHGP
jgi:hypothetical protein